MIRIGYANRIGYVNRITYIVVNPCMYNDDEYLTGPGDLWHM